MAVTEQVILDLTRAQAQIRDLDREFQTLAAPITVDVQLDAADDITRLRRDLSNVDATVNIDVSGLQAIDEAADDANRLEREFSQARAEAAKVADQAERVKTELREANVASGGFASRVRDIATVFAGLTAARSAFNFLAAGVQDAAALAESINRINILFDDLSGEIIAFSENSTAALVLTQRELLDAVGTFAGLANVVGLTREESVQFGITLTDLAADLASFGDTSVDDAVLALSSALRGESEPIRRYNVLLNEATITAKALELGLAGANGEISEAAKVQARYAVILEQTVIAQGDLEATQDSLGNRLKSTRVDFLELRQALGEAVVPALEQVLDVLPAFIGLVEDAGPAVGFLASSVGDVVASLEPFAEAIELAKTPLEGLVVSLKEIPGGESLFDSLAAGAGSLLDQLNPLAGLSRTLSDVVDFFDSDDLPDISFGLDPAEALLMDRLTQRTEDAATAQRDLADARRESYAGYDPRQDQIIIDSLAATARETRNAALGFAGLSDTIDQLQVAGNVFAPLESELEGIQQAFEDTFAPDQNGEVFANIDELIADINRQFADAAEFESGLAELASRGFDDVAATFRERGPETIGLLREALADPSAAAALESTLDAVGTAAGEGYAEGFAIGFNAESAALALEIAASVSNASVQQGIIAGALEMALLFAANFDPQILIDNFDISLPPSVIQANVGPGADLLGGGSSTDFGAQGSARGFTVNIVNPTVTDLDTSVGQATSTLGAISGLVQ